MRLNCTATAPHPLASSPSVGSADVAARAGRARTAPAPDHIGVWTYTGGNPVFDQRTERVAAPGGVCQWTDSAFGLQLGRWRFGVTSYGGIVGQYCEAVLRENLIGYTVTTRNFGETQRCSILP